MTIMHINNEDYDKLIEKIDRKIEHEEDRARHAVSGSSHERHSYRGVAFKEMKNLVANYARK